jgi:hypothetical protein
MKKIPQQTEEKLLEYIDGVLSAEDVIRIEKMIRSDHAVKERLEELREAGRFLSGTSWQHPSHNFTQKVLERLNDQPQKSTVSIRKSIYLLAAIIVTIALATLLVTTGTFDGTTSLNLNEMVQTKYLKQPLPTFSFDGKLLVNVIIVLNIIIAFIVLDRTILKPWFDRRNSY